jgi:hypothetical protein
LQSSKEHKEDDFRIEGMSCEFYAKYFVSSSIMVSQYGWHTEILRLSGRVYYC